jgi:thiamine transporter ThiT
MVYRFSVGALLKYILPFLDMKIAGLSKRVIEKKLRLHYIN